MKRYLLALVGVVALVLLSGLLWERFSTEALPAQAGVQQVNPVSLRKSMAPLQRYFNEGKKKPRLLVLLSPT